MPGEFAESNSRERRVLSMTSKEIRDKALAWRLGKLGAADSGALWEIAAQLAELNERASNGGFPVRIEGAAGLDLHGLFVAAAALQRRKGK